MALDSGNQHRALVVRVTKMEGGADQMTVRPGTRADIAQAAVVLSRAFADVEPFTWIQPDPELRARIEPVTFHAALRFLYPIEHGTEVLADGGKILGCAMWAPPGKWKASPWRQLRSVPLFIRELGMKNMGEYGKRGRAVEDALQAAHPSEPHWYLAGLGVDPDAQGQGIGTGLVRSGLARCDRERADAYLECLFSLVPYYQAFGFDVVGHIDMPEGTPPQASMWRPAR
jgi:ribosomal protein S18 acetylase RimI-like enzyme